MTAAPISPTIAFSGLSQPRLSITPADTPLSSQVEEAYQKMAELWILFLQGNTGDDLLKIWRSKNTSDVVIQPAGYDFMHFSQAYSMERETGPSQSQIDTFKTALVSRMITTGLMSLSLTRSTDRSYLLEACNAAMLRFPHNAQGISVITSLLIQGETIVLEIDRGGKSSTIKIALPESPIQQETNSLKFVGPADGIPPHIPPVLGIAG